jgi:hypothetical protein
MKITLGLISKANKILKFSISHGMIQISFYSIHMKSTSYAYGYIVSHLLLSFWKTVVRTQMDKNLNNTSNVSLVL